ncbi:BZ3500_MvSof-1268-A1-R1_Chr1-3g02490 [Microbotryum saponariae]|uniref:BZ3500_MvSof-1268-A1-R1_Chr1-3g02490 protein n=1 Tax=Microbotryum saponariae TaxID=289078 RepID=A0A2X0KF06_9BASI|nr:BZ3500_MvSof-1268-A1-R1_Chr1-3g02490 [Microbotryum saponariae]SCZ96386.1 BZ3501_MvSof-1269-A2-R1_Chr1-3g02093 [Microbotryum saponariae]
MQLFTLLIAAAPALTSFVSASALTADEMAVEKRNLYKHCCNGILWKRDDTESLEKRTFCLRKRNLWIYKCPTTPTCNPLNCPKPSNSLALCTNDQCDFQCLGDTIKVGSICVKPCSPWSCPAVANATPVCKDDQSCDFNCNSGFNEVDGKCVPNCDPTKCPVVANSQSICTSSGDCDFNCNSGFNKVNGVCVPNTPTCDASQCPACANGTPICTDNKCDLKCDTGFSKQDGQCVPNVPTCTKKSVAFYDNFQSTADGELAVTVASIDACAAYCLTKNCASFDFWDGNQCGIQIGGGGFDGFQYSPGVVHGVPGQCSDYTDKCPEKVAVKACYNKSVCPATAARLRRSHSKRLH